MKCRTITAACAMVATGLFGIAQAAQGAERVIPNFKAVCKPSHVGRVDPIVAPGVISASHLHEFFGNRSTSAFSTTKSLDASTSTCIVLDIATTTDDDSPYWVPALFLNGARVAPVRLTAYYTLGHRKPGTIRPWLHGFRVIAGDSHATTAQDTHKVAWRCQGGTGGVSAKPGNCGRGTVTLNINFPDCWDGVHLDSPDHHSHAAYSAASPRGLDVCPASHPVAVPGLRIYVSYPLADATGAVLSSGGPYSGHADFWNTWTPEVLRERIDTCVNGAVLCR